MTDIEDIKQLVAAAASAAESANATAERSFMLADDNRVAIAAMQQQMVTMQQEIVEIRRDMRQMQTSILEVRTDIRGLQQENRRILDVLLNQRGED